MINFRELDDDTSDFVKAGNLLSAKLLSPALGRS
jgi:hypothetical protein